MGGATNAVKRGGDSWKGPSTNNENALSATYRSDRGCYCHDKEEHCQCKTDAIYGLDAKAAFRCTANLDGIPGNEEVLTVEAHEKSDDDANSEENSVKKLQPLGYSCHRTAGASESAAARDAEAAAAHCCTTTNTNN